VIFDLGANVGFSCLDFGTRFPGARVIGVEMDADNVGLARRNTAVLGDRSEIVHAAIWKEDSEVSYSKSAEEWGYHISGGEDGAASVVVRAIAIDTLMQEAGVDWVDYMKIDIEGAEDEILVSDARWLACTGELNIEIHAPATYEKCSQILTRSGFVCRRSNRHKNSVLAKRPQPAR
jgi:FkbM family methyltransferase